MATVASSPGNPWKLRLLFLASAVLFLVLAAVDRTLWDEGGPGIIGFELAWDRESSARILAEWGPDGRGAARLSLWLDFLFLAAYSGFWALAARRLDLRVWQLAPVAGAFDALENVCLLVVLDGAEGDPWPVLASCFATAKFVLLAVVIGSVAFVLVRRFPRPAIALALVGVVALAVNTWLVDRATEPARPGIGRILELPGGDVHVREDGRRGRPPVVLIHGFGCSMRWWNGVVSTLARDLHVIRVDLLGHGGSEKPREGYSMEEQADLVAGVIRSLGLRRAAVVGHSMGGMVGTALVERHPALVSRLMLIGTASEDSDQDLPLTARLPFVPVVGHVIDTLIDDRLVREAVEAGFAPAFDPPAGLEDDVFDRTTYRSLTGSAKALSDYWDEAPIHERLADKGVSLTVLMGLQERHTRRSTPLYNSVRGARTVVMGGLDHSPHVESPERTAPLIVAFVRGA